MRVIYYSLGLILTTWVVAADQSFSHQIHHQNLSFPEKLNKINETLNHLVDLDDSAKLEFLMLASQILTDDDPQLSVDLAQQGLFLAQQKNDASKAVFFASNCWKNLPINPPKLTNNNCMPSRPSWII